MIDLIRKSVKRFSNKVFYKCYLQFKLHSFNFYLSEGEEKHHESPTNHSHSHSELEGIDSTIGLSLVLGMSRVYDITFILRINLFLVLALGNIHIYLLM